MSLMNDRRHDGGPSLTRLRTAIFRSRTAAVSIRLSERALRRGSVARSAGHLAEKPADPILDLPA